MDLITLLRTTILFASFMLSINACSVPENYRSLSYEEQIFKGEIVVHGKDLEHVNISSLSGGLVDAIEIKFEVFCVYKGDHTTISENITIGPHNLYNSCHSGEPIQVGDEAIILLKKPSNGKYQLQFIDMGYGVFPATVEKLHTAVTVCGLQTPKYPYDRPQNSTNPMCRGPPLDLECTDGAMQKIMSVITVFVISANAVFFNTLY